MKFIKMHGIGNDYVYVDCFKEEIKNPGAIAEIISDRHFGIGSDGLILIKPSAVADCCMDMYNADGSRGAMCGNGIRCVGKYVYEQKIVEKTEILVETLSGIKHLKLKVENGVVTAVTVDMGKPVLESENGKVWETITLPDGQEYEMIVISMGNPHTVVFLEDLNNLDIEALGPKFENHERFPDRVNTEFVQVIDKTHLKMRVWERGSGETLACGTGACAAAVAAVLAGYTEREVEVGLLGGALFIRWDIPTGHIEMTGPATEVYRGEFNV